MGSNSATWWQTRTRIPEVRAGLPAIFLRYLVHRKRLDLLCPIESEVPAPLCVLPQGVADTAAPPRYHHAASSRCNSPGWFPERCHVFCVSFSPGGEEKLVNVPEPADCGNTLLTEGRR